MAPSTTVGYAFGGVAVLITVWLSLRRKQSHPYPPGPPADPIIGHLRVLPPENQEIVFHEWGQKYGDVIHLRIPGRSILVLDSHEAAVDLLDKRSAIYSSRPKLITIEMMGFDPTVTFMPYGKRYLKHRKMLQNAFGKQETMTYYPIVIRETNILLNKLLESPDSFEKALQRFTTAVIVKVAFGHDITSDDDLYIELADNLGTAMNNTGPVGNTPVDFLPFLRYLPGWFPGTHYAQWSKKWYGPMRKLHDYPYAHLEQQMAAGKAETCFLSSLIEQLDDTTKNDPEHIADIKGAAGVIYAAGSDTSWSTLTIFILCMVLFPDCQKKAQEEIDRVIGSGRLPEFGDRESLPYVEAILQETLRWCPAVHLGVPHYTTEDDIYKEMFIPKGTLVIPNTTGIFQNENSYKNPKQFNPNRFLAKSLGGNEEPAPLAAFGYGRRICPGRFLADASVWLVMASILSVFDIKRKRDKIGNEIIPEVKFTHGIVHHPAPFPCDIVPRSPQAAALVSRA